MVPFGGVHAFGYNSAESEPIWMKSGALWVHCWGRALADFGRDPRSRDSWRTRRYFVFICQVSNKRFTDFPCAKLHEIWTQNVDQCRDENFQNKISKILP